jgi:hypothetical protein
MVISFATPLQIQMIPADQPAEPSILGLFAVEYNDVRFQGENMASEMKSGTYATVSVTWTDKGGNPVAVDGSTKWESSDPAIMEIQPSTGNPLIANLHSLGPIGSVEIHASADGDMGPNVRTVSAVYDVTVVKGDAVAGEITFSQNVGQGTPKEAPPSGKPATATGGTPSKR